MLIQKGKTNWKFLLIVIVLAIIVSVGILGYQWWIEKQETKIPELKISEKVDIKKYLHKDAILRGIEIPPEAEYKAISLEEAIRFAIQHLKNRGVKEIKICETSWFLAPFGGFIIDGKGDFSIGEKTYSTFRIGVFDGSWPEKQKAGEEFLFIARGEDDKGNIIWYPEPGPDFQPTEGGPFPEELMAYEFLSDREKFESLSSRFIDVDETADWRTYRNEEYGFEIKYPEVYDEEEHNCGIKEFDRHFIVGSLVGLLIEDSEGLTLSEYVDNDTNEFIEMFPVFHIESKESIYIGGEKAVKVSYGSYNQRAYLLKNGKIYKFSIFGIEGPRCEFRYGLNESKYISEVDVFNQMLSTFRFIEEETCEKWRAKCAEEGESLCGPCGCRNCCSGLITRDVTYPRRDKNNEIFCLEEMTAYTCVKCGDKICGKGEDWCICPEDCSKPNPEDLQIFIMPE